ncbi:hypothetical protein [Blastococcus capsensis]|uniref:hypothetical protein n=1 Tax=Blastococcus capsensis TaxID=1564163 RepID=UPI002541A2E4|nr:hypothetical protein [Blastococcus capsensis]MDK3257156.1 hypothetical protein [Blastococcus capsensis]
MVVGSMLVWPVVTLVGFLSCIAVVVALGATSTARYEFARNAAQQPRPVVAPRADNHPAGRRAATRPGAAAADGQGQGQAIAVAVRPAPAPQAPTGPAWWLVDDAAQVLAGPFDDQVDAEWAALAGELAAIAVHGVRRADATIAPRPSPVDRSWLAELGDQLDRLPEDWDALLSDTDPLTTLVVEVAAALVEAGLPLHDAAGGRPAGGVCLVPDVASGGVLVGWRTHDRMSVQGVRGTAADAAVQQLMNDAVACTLAQLGFVVQTFGEVGCSLVTALR